MKLFLQITSFLIVSFTCFFSASYSHDHEDIVGSEIIEMFYVEGPEYGIEKIEPYLILALSPRDIIGLISVSRQEWPGSIYLDEELPAAILKTGVSRLDIGYPGSTTMQFKNLTIALKTLHDSEYDLTVNIPSDWVCTSGCAFLFLTAAKKTCEPNSKIQLHSGSQGGELVDALDGIISIMKQGPIGLTEEVEQFMIEQERKGVFSRLEVTDFSCQELVDAGVATFRK